jgi:hypothetical protein
LGHLPNKAEKTAVNRTELTAAENIPEKPQAIEENMNDDKLKHNRSAKFTDLEVEQLEKIMIGCFCISRHFRRLALFRQQ